MILTDMPRSYQVPNQANGTCWAHLVSDTSVDELHTFATMLGLRRSWFQHVPGHFPHYDITESKWRKAITLGAEAVTHHELARRTVR